MPSERIRAFAHFARFGKGEFISIINSNPIYCFCAPFFQCYRMGLRSLTYFRQLLPIKLHAPVRLEGPTENFQINNPYKVFDQSTG